RQPAVEQGLLTLNPNETVSTNHQEKALSFEFKTERQETNTLTDPPDDDSKLTPFKPPAMKSLFGLPNLGLSTLKKIKRYNVVLRG
ncbi:hypothetical protein, partial [Enterovibrio norvegicus]|uniref:hypothetical protein n=1 Tax=Enterovibrio norvegicus TaxID=188144 RepID=UPI000550AAB8